MNRNPVDKSHRDVKEKLLPADIDEILKKYGHLLADYPAIAENGPIYPEYKRTKRLLYVLFPLKKHPVHGITGLLAIEKYDADGYVEKYSYQWKVIYPKMGKMFKHISAWENEPHDAEWTEKALQVESEPHHHHHVPGDRKQRQANWDVWTLDEAFAFVAEYIESGKEYKP
ncbi:DUF6516 family protein [Ureibacillus sp. FSL K6-8385]|uniref:toxin-antitoxin system TumE family protein n=1 Tax=Ureibacillus TaxID=160795 RepID=UPI002E1D56D8|nr:DUF6516 family protein [Ureibacillus terrenus]